MLLRPGCMWQDILQKHISASFSIIYSFDGKNFYKSQTIEGEVSAVSKKRITFTYDDYTQAGLQRYHSVSTYKLGSNGTLTEKLNEYLEVMTNPDTLEEKTVEHSYHKMSNKIK